MELKVEDLYERWNVTEWEQCRDDYVIGQKNDGTPIYASEQNKQLPAMINNKFYDMLDLIFTPNPDESIGVRSVPTTQEIRDKNEQKMRIALYDRDCKIREHKVQCSDGEEFEILEIRGPKASGFFYAKNYGVFDSLRFFLFFLFFFCFVCAERRN